MLIGNVCGCRLQLSITSHVSLAMIIWQTLSAARNVLVAQKFTNILLVIIAGTDLQIHLQHLIDCLSVPTCFSYCLSQHACGFLMV